MISNTMLPNIYFLKDFLSFSTTFTYISIKIMKYKFITKFSYKSLWNLKNYTFSYNLYINESEILIIYIKYLFPPNVHFYGLFVLTQLPTLLLNIVEWCKSNNSLSKHNILSSFIRITKRVIKKIELITEMKLEY